MAASREDIKAVFYIDHSGIILGKVGTGRDISRPMNCRLDPVFRIVQSVRPGPRTGLHKIQAVRPISGLDGTPSGVSKDGTDCSRRRSTAKAPQK